MFVSKLSGIKIKLSSVKKRFFLYHFWFGFKEYQDIDMGRLSNILRKKYIMS